MSWPLGLWAATRGGAAKCRSLPALLWAPCRGSVISNVADSRGRSPIPAMAQETEFSARTAAAQRPAPLPAGADARPSWGRIAAFVWRPFLSRPYVEIAWPPHPQCVVLLGAVYQPDRLPYSAKTRAAWFCPSPTCRALRQVMIEGWALYLTSSRLAAVYEDRLRKNSLPRSMHGFAAGVNQFRASHRLNFSARLGIYDRSVVAWGCQRLTALSCWVFGPDPIFSRPPTGGDL